jgi:hypothetical protein
MSVRFWGASLFMLSPKQALALRTPDKVVDERTNEMDEDDDKQPGLVFSS